MESNQSILYFASLVISFCLGFFAIRPKDFLDLVEEKNFYSSGFFLALFALFYLDSDGRVLLSIISSVALFIAILRLPVLRFVEHHNGDGVVQINRVVHRYFWPAKQVKERYGYRRGKVAFVLPWIDAVVGFQYIHDGQIYHSMKDLNEEKSYLIHNAEKALLKALE